MNHIPPFKKIVALRNNSKSDLIEIVNYTVKKHIMKHREDVVKIYFDSTIIERSMQNRSSYEAGIFADTERLQNYPKKQIVIEKHHAGVIYWEVFHQNNGLDMLYLKYFPMEVYEPPQQLKPIVN